MELFVHRPENEHPGIVEVEATALVRTLLVDEDSEGRIWSEEVDEEIDLDITIEQAGIHHHDHVHAGSCHQIDITVRYNGDTFEHRFGPAKTIKTVQKWAFGPTAAYLSKEQQAEHVLGQPESDHFLEDGVHVSSLVTRGSCAVILDLLPRSRFAG